MVSAPWIWMRRYRRERALLEVGPESVFLRFSYEVPTRSCGVALARSVAGLVSETTDCGCVWIKLQSTAGLYLRAGPGNVA
jgi:hypothetical protein